METDSVPIISVVMSVFNGEEYLPAAIDSILSQTFGDFEFIIVEDGSSDRSAEIIRAYSDVEPRIKVIENSENLGLAASLNKGIKAAKGNYIARMDSDDVSSHQRFEIQLEQFSKHSDLLILGSAVRVIGEDEEFRYSIIPPQDPVEIYWNILTGGCPAFVHPTVMMRKCVFDLIGYYDEHLKVGQDYALWNNLITKDVSPESVSNLPDELLIYRSHADTVSLKHRSLQIATGNQIRESTLNCLLDMQGNHSWANEELCFTPEDRNWSKFIQTYQILFDSFVEKYLPSAREIRYFENLLWQQIARKVSLIGILKFALNSSEVSGSEARKLETILRIFHHKFRSRITSTKKW